MSDALEVMKSMLSGFVRDPADNEFQRGFLEGLVVFAHEGLGMRMDDDVVRQASDMAYAEIVAPQPKRRAFQIIDGGKKEGDEE